MASPVSHIAVALSIGTCFYRPGMPRRVWAIGALCSVIPDLDVIGFRYGIRYGDFWGHRGFTHSILFALFIASVALSLSFLGDLRGLSRFSVWMYFVLVTASHGLLDAMTDGGLGVAFFSPLDTHRYFLPWRPIAVSPISFRRLFFTSRGLAVFQSEILWIWVPAALLAVSAWMLRRRSSVSGVGH